MNPCRGADMNPISALFFTCELLADVVDAKWRQGWRQHHVRGADNVRWEVFAYREPEGSTARKLA